MGMPDKSVQKKDTRIQDVLLYAALVLLGVSMFFYVRGSLVEFIQHRKISLLPVMALTVTFALSAGALYLLKKRNKDLHGIIYFLVLFSLYALRAPQDIYTTYMWGEDGQVLLQEAIQSGPASLIHIHAGTLWLIQRLIALLCYWVCRPFSDLSLFPQIQGIVSKLLAVASISYFLTDRFEWLIKERFYRFLACAMVILAIPFYACDITVCDTSLPFILNFMVFLIGLDTFCNKGARPLTLFEAIFLSIQGLSTAAAPFPAAVAFLAFARWFFTKKKDMPKRKKIFLEAAKALVPCVCSLIQVLCVLSSSRSGTEWNLGERLKLCVKDFVFIPYNYSYKSWILFLIALLGFLALAFLAKMPKLPLIYTAVFSFGFLLYCSMVVDTSEMTQLILGEANGSSRYILMSYMLAAFLLGLEIGYLWKDKKLCKSVGCVVFAVYFANSFFTYSQSVIGCEFIDCYKDHIEVYNPDGYENLFIPVGPWLPWHASIPWDKREYTRSSDPNLLYAIDSIGGMSPSDVTLVEGMEYNHFELLTWAATPEGEPFEHVFIWLGGVTYQAPVSTFHREAVSENLDNDADYGFIFYIYEAQLLLDDQLTFAGITEDGRIYFWAVDVNPHY